MTYSHFASVPLPEIHTGQWIDTLQEVRGEIGMAMCAYEAVALDTTVGTTGEDLTTTEAIALDAIERCGFRRMLLEVPLPHGSRDVREDVGGLILLLSGLAHQGMFHRRHSPARLQH